MNKNEQCWSTFNTVQDVHVAGIFTVDRPGLKRGYSLANLRA
ncbi:hypothetical protein RBSWK_03312 [Rhodopirellula baltica SWK14]|uniref:Uncharacterized protein n=1 Tax=Rhodopirellula baltica SWK14 TaxID=993516 RepID=L7CI39_RHOBT|nr:hypothetical protein RBSWK_03312 [Rhodopirellula baltica SWK14]